MRYLNLFEAKSSTSIKKTISKKGITDDILETAKMVFSYVIDDYSDLIKITSTTNYISINIKNPCSIDSKYEKYKEQVNKWSDLINSVDEAMEQLKATVESIEYDISINSTGIRIMIKILKNISEIPVVKVNKVTIVFNEPKFMKLIKDLDIPIRNIYPSHISFGDWRSASYRSEPSIRFFLNELINVDDSKELVSKLDNIVKSLGFKTRTQNVLNSRGEMSGFHVVLIEHVNKRIEFKKI